MGSRLSLECDGVVLAAAKSTARSCWTPSARQPLQKRHAQPSSTAQGRRRQVAASPRGGSLKGCGSRGSVVITPAACCKVGSRLSLECGGVVLAAAESTARSCWTPFARQPLQKRHAQPSSPAQGRRRQVAASPRGGSLKGCGGRGSVVLTLAPGVRGWVRVSVWRVAGWSWPLQSPRRGVAGRRPPAGRAQQCSAAREDGDRAQRGRAAGSLGMRRSRRGGVGGGGVAEGVGLS
ncbi:hypothetical protein BZB76_0615 [Actinomadura pelletieri DSM 43383]|uniref:Uncharacterized protein n=1 Tax=Actinomadura pelletieri DSM 43383 TaxID=1120940 RepID=A0A495QYH3_9ACTN|nr:hypothetical protein BZB76_0615 [Actinomadura pelletieri DSM 43383]